MTIKRALIQARFWLFAGNHIKRAEYAKRKNLYAGIGENCKLNKSLPLYPKLVRIHNNVTLHHSVELVTHDAINAYLSRIPNFHQFKHKEILGPIELMDNVYIGMNSVIMPGVRIGPNAIVSAGSIVTTDVPPNSVVAGVPAKAIGTFDSFVKIRILQDKMLPFEFKHSAREMIDEETTAKAWDAFDKKRR